MFKIFKIILWVLLVLTVVIMLSLAAIWFYPKLLVNKNTLSWLYQKQTTVQFEKGFPDSFDIDISNSGLMSKVFKLQASNFCVEADNNQMHVCIDQFKLKVHLDFSGLSIKIKSVGPLIVHSKSLQYSINDNNKDTSSSNQKKNSGAFAVNDYLSENFKLGVIDVQFPSIKVTGPNSEYTGSVSLNGESKSKTYALKLNSNFEDFKNQAQAQFKANLNTQDFKNIEGALDLNGTLNTIKANFSGDYAANIYKQKGSFSGKGHVDQLSDWVTRFYIKGLELSNNENLSLSLSFSSKLNLDSLSAEKQGLVSKSNLNTAFSGSIKAKELSKGIIDFSVILDPTRQFESELMAKAEGTFEQNTQKLNLKFFLINLKIPKFEALVKKLENSQWAIPAPINDLKGSLNFNLGKDNLENLLNQDEYLLPVVLDSKLKSKTQALQFKTLGDIKFNSVKKDLNVSLDADLNNIAIVLPDFDPVSKMPNIASDERIITQAEKKELAKAKKKSNQNLNKKSEDDFKVSFEINIDTPEKPIRVKYDLFKPAALLRVKGKITEESSNIIVKAEPFKIEYLKREAKLEKFILENNSKDSSIKLDGRFSIEKADYDLYVDIEQRYEKTRITLSSDPPLPEEDIISLILFNEVSNEINSGSSGSVENTQAALAQKTIGFFSFFVLASTPVESVNYDPNTGTYSARVKLPGGFTGTVGSDWDKAQEVGIRKSLGGNWAISAGVGTDSQGEEKQESMLEWFLRY